MSTQENSQALSDFFSRYDSNAFTYNPRNDSNEEFDRLCDARQWDQIKREKKLEKYLTALHGHSSSPSGMFFRKYWVPDFVYNPSGNQRNAFNRLQERMKWDGTELEEALKEFQAAAGRNAAPIAVFLMGQKIPGYSYGSERAELEFRKLVGAHRHIWEQEIEMGHDVEDGEGRRKWRESTEFKSLQEGFYDAVEQHFGVTLDKIGLEAGLRRDEVLAELYRVGKAPLTKKEAETVSLYPNSQGSNFQPLTRKITTGLRIRPLKRLRFHSRKRCDHIRPRQLQGERSNRFTLAYRAPA